MASLTISFKSPVSSELKEPRLISDSRYPADLRFDYESPRNCGGTVSFDHFWSKVIGFIEHSSVPHSDGHSGTQAAAAGQGAQLLQAGFHRPFSAVLSDTPVRAFSAGKHVLHEPARSHVSASSIHLPVGPERLYGFFSVFPLFQADAGMPSMPSYHQTIFDMPRPVLADTSGFFQLPLPDVLWGNL